MPVRHHPFTALALAAALVASAVPAATAAPTTAPAAAPAQVLAADVTAPAEAARVDPVTATIAWRDCSSVVSTGVRCGTVDVPLDYDEPEGATTRIALLHVPARKPASRIGTLFLNPGGPGGSAVELAAMAQSWLPAGVVDRFDLVGVDPRGIGYSEAVSCFRTAGERIGTIGPLASPLYPRSTAERSAAVAAARAVGAACTTTGQPLSSAMSTANVARDMDVVRRLLGDEKLSYLGFSYGSYLGTVYANLFPDRVRAVVVDGVMDPVAYAGTEETRGVPEELRSRSGDGAWKAFRSILERCGKKGPAYCQTAQLTSNPVRRFEKLAAQLKAKPVDLGDGQLLTYQGLMSTMLGVLYYPEPSGLVDMFLADALVSASTPTTAAERRARDAAIRSLRQHLAAHEKVVRGDEALRERLATGFPGASIAFDNQRDGNLSVVCTDGLHPGNAASWVAAGNTAAKTGDAFGQIWTWSSVPCASWTWKAVDEDAYRGPFTAETSAPVLVVGNWWDPATNYDGARALAGLLPNSALVSSSSWGHTALNTSACVDTAVERYLLTGRATRGSVLRCVGDAQPFTYRLDGAEAASPRSPLRPIPWTPGVTVTTLEQG